MTLLSIDPGRSYRGDKTIGVSYWEYEEIGETGRMEWQEVFRESLSWEEFFEKLDLSPVLDFSTMMLTGESTLVYGEWVVDEIVCEDFVNDPKSARGGQRNGTSETIGGIEVMALKAKVPFTRQRSMILGPAKLLASYKDTRQHLPHQDSAYLHGYYRLVDTGRLQSKGLADTL